MPVLDGLRGLAMLMVLFHHLVILAPAGWFASGILQLFDLGKHGLDLFFVLSGFLITGILLDSRGQRHYFRNFYARRTLRVFPLYYAVLALILLILPVLLGQGRALYPLVRSWTIERQEWPWYVGYVSNFLFVARDSFGPPALDVTWSLAIEEQYYLAWAIAVCFLTPRRAAWLCGGVIVISPLVRLVSGLSGASWLQVYLATPCRMDGIAAGSLLAALLRLPECRPERLLRVARIVATAAACGLILLYPGKFLYGMKAVGLVAGFSLTSLLFAAVMLLLLFAPAGDRAAGVFGGRWLGFFGKYSYAIYLTHMPVRDIMRRLLFTDAQLSGLHGLSLLGRQVLYFVIGIGGPVALACLSWHLYEKQWLKLKRHFPR